jgi:hypothetical protein
MTRSWHEWARWLETAPLPKTIVNEPYVELRLVVNNEPKGGEEEQREEARRKAQAELDRWIEWRRADEEYARRRQRELDPFNWGHWK